MILKFFESGVYQPELMKDNMMLPWPEDTPEFKFPCHTSLIDENIILKSIGTTRDAENDDNKEPYDRKKLRSQKLKPKDEYDTNT